MTLLTKFSLIVFCLLSTLSFAQKLKSFEINGNYNFDDDEYFKWTRLQISQPYFDGIIDSAKNRIAYNLTENGFYFFEFTQEKIEISFDSTSFSISISIEEGDPVIVKNVFIESNDSISISDLQKRFELVVNDYLNKIEIESLIDKALTEFENAGYPFARIIISGIEIFQDSINQKNYANISLKIDKETRSKIDKIEISGNNSTKDYVITRELRLVTGELYSQKKIEELPKRLNRLRFFEPVAQPSFYFNSKNEGVLLIEVKEKNTNNFDGILGYIPPAKNEQSGYLTGLINISLRNLFGTGRAAALRWNKFNRNSQELDLKYLEPWFLGYPVNINLNLYQKIQDSTYVQRKFETAVEYLATEDISASLFASTESVIPTERSIPVFTVFNSSYLSTGLSLKIDTRDDPYSPTEGLIFINSYTYSRKKITGPNEYISPSTITSINLQRISVTFNFYYLIFNRQVIAIGVNGRELRGSSLESSDLFRLGGNNTLRGYREEQFLGSRVFWSNLEYRFLFASRTYGFAFFDTGYYLQSENLEKNIIKQEDFLYGFGFGLNLETALGVLKVSYALGEGDTFSDGKIHFGLVNEF